MLYSLTVIVNFVFLVVAVWLGVYLVTRSPRSLVAWLTGLTLWSIAGIFLNLLLTLTPPNSNRLPSHALKRFLAGLPFFQFLRQ